MGLIARVVAFISLLLVSWISLITFIPVIGGIISYGESQGSFNSPLVPDFFTEGIFWSFELFLLGTVGIVGLWAVIAALKRVGFGMKR
jgi:hypothetical protein